MYRNPTNNWHQYRSILLAFVSIKRLMDFINSPAFLYIVFIVASAITAFSASCKYLLI